MKTLLKLSLVLMLSLMSVNAMAEIGYFRTTEFAMKERNAYGYWGNWTNWQSSDMLITINFSTDVVTIYSPSTQIYRITKHISSYIDNNGGQTIEYAFVDQDGDMGHMRLRIDPNGTAQLYVDFNNIMWVYNIIRTN